MSSFFSLNFSWEVNGCNLSTKNEIGCNVNPTEFGLWLGCATNHRVYMVCLIFLHYSLNYTKGNCCVLSISCWFLKNIIINSFSSHSLRLTACIFYGKCYIFRCTVRLYDITQLPCLMALHWSHPCYRTFYLGLLPQRDVSAAYALLHTIMVHSASAYPYNVL